VFELLLQLSNAGFKFFTGPSLAVFGLVLFRKLVQHNLSQLENYGVDLMEIRDYHFEFEESIKNSFVGESSYACKTAGDDNLV